MSTAHASPTPPASAILRQIAQWERAQQPAKDLVGFARESLRSDLWDIQARILESVERNPRTAVKACHSSGKSFLAARAVLGWLARYESAIVVTTAPTQVQVEKVLWGEVHTALADSRFKFPRATLTDLRMGPKRYATGLTTSVQKGNEGVRMQGFHADHVLVIIDEAPGVDPKIMDAIEGARAGGDVRILMLGNPTIASGPFHDAFTENRGGWALFTISAFDTPNLAGLSIDELLLMSPEQLDINDRPYLTTRRWVYDRWHEWGDGHPLWESRVLGQFPSQAEDALLSLAWLEAAKTGNSGNSGKLIAGLDVAGPGEDETVLVIRDGGQIVFSGSWATSDPRGDVIAAMMPFKDQIKKVNVDVIGIGWGMARHLEDQGFAVGNINVGEAPADPEKYANLKAELYWGLRMRFQEGHVSGLADEKTVGQLAGIRYKHDARGRVVIESKEDARKRGVHSPDRAEAVMLAFAEVREEHSGIFNFYRDQAR